MTGIQLSEGATASDESRELAKWLASLVHGREYGQLADLRRPGMGTSAHIQAEWFSGTREEGRRVVYRHVAFLFALYHRGESRPRAGAGSLGSAARGIGDGAGHGPDNPGALRLMDRIVASRRLPYRHLQHCVARLRSCEKWPPEWARLTDDLLLWTNRRASVRYRWAVDFHEPPLRAAPKKSKSTSTPGMNETRDETQ